MTVTPSLPKSSEIVLERSKHAWTKAKRLPTFCVVVPVCNNEKTIAGTIISIDSFLQTVKARTAIIAVEMGSKDQSPEILKLLSQSCPRLIVITSPTVFSYGAASRCGFRTAIDHGFDYALIVGSDIEHCGGVIKEFLRPMMMSYDFIKASRRAPHSTEAPQPVYKRIADGFVNALGAVFLQLPISDYSCPVRAIKCTLLARMMTERSGLFMLLEESIQASKLAAKVCEVTYRNESLNS